MFIIFIANLIIKNHVIIDQHIFYFIFNLTYNTQYYTFIYPVIIMLLV